jgi:hypothetical protein
LLKKHYLPNDHKRQNKQGKWVDIGLGDLIVLAEKRYEWVRQAALRPRVKHIDDILHDYSRVRRLDASDDKIVVDFLITLRSLISLAIK